MLRCNNVARSVARTWMHERSTNVTKRAQHHATSKNVARKIWTIKFDPASSNMLQHIATGWPNVCNMRAKMLCYVVLKCCVRLRAFGRAYLKAPSTAPSLQLERTFGFMHVDGRETDITDFGGSWDSYSTNTCISFYLTDKTKSACRDLREGFPVPCDQPRSQGREDDRPRERGCPMMIIWIIF